MNPVVAKVLKKTLTTSATVVGALFVVYFWNLDQKLMGWLYKQVNTMFDRKPTDIKFWANTNRNRRFPLRKRRFLSPIKIPESGIRGAACGHHASSI